MTTKKRKIGIRSIKVIDAAPNNYDGGMQIDNVTVTCQGNEYNFELATPAGGDGDVHVKYEGSESPDEDFINHFELVEDVYFKFEEDKKGLKDFLHVNQPSCEGDSIELDGYELEITHFIHSGGMEFGWIEAEIRGETIKFEMEQDATCGSMDYTISFLDEEYEAIANQIGFVLTSEIEEYLFDRYDSICAEHR